MATSRDAAVFCAIVLELGYRRRHPVGTIHRSLPIGWAAVRAGVANLELFRGAGVDLPCPGAVVTCRSALPLSPVLAVLTASARTAGRKAVAASRSGQRPTHPPGSQRTNDRRCLSLRCGPLDLCRVPESATACSCTACRRYGTLWAYDFEDEGIRVSGQTRVYARAGATSAFIFVRTADASPIGARWHPTSRAAAASPSTSGSRNPRRWPPSSWITSMDLQPGRTCRATADA
jgi:hypothetical protein